MHIATSWAHVFLSLAAAILLFIKHHTPKERSQWYIVTFFAISALAALIEVFIILKNPTYARQQSPIRPTTDSHRVVHTIIPNHLLPRLASPKLAQSQALLFDLSTRHSSSHHRYHRPLPKQYPAYTRRIWHAYCMGQYRFYCAIRIVHTTTDTCVLVDVAMYAWSCRL